MIPEQVIDVRTQLASQFVSADFVADKSGCRVLEVAPCDFMANEPSVFGEVSADYVRREIAWYESMSLNVADIPGGAPEIWKRVADRDGYVNSNYGYAYWHPANFRQYKHVLEELRRNPDSRRACVIIQRPSMWLEHGLDGRSDFCCTWGHTYRIRDGKLDLIVVMRSNDAVYGYKNDRAFAEHAQSKLAGDLGVPVGRIFWHADSFHVYERHFYLVHHYVMTGEKTITKKAYRERYPNSPWLEEMDRENVPRDNGPRDNGSCDDCSSFDFSCTGKCVEKK